jgi:predicted ATPase/DNA-binding CsgD family transcriptional regulator
MTADGLTPAEISSFIGRGDEVAELAGLLPNVRALTLCGAGGIGKTRLALRLVAASDADYPDGIWFVDVGDLQRPDLVVARVAAVVGVDEEPGRLLTDTLAEAVRYRKGLLVLDNCEQLIEACGRLCQRLLADAPDLTVLATSREPLHVAAETVWPVPPLALPPEGVTSPAELMRYDSVRLFAERAAAAASGFRLGPENAAGVAMICRELDGLPLAIELAAAWVRVLSIDQIAARIGDRFGLLTGANRIAPARQQTLRAAIESSYHMLTDWQQLLLRRLSVFGEWSLDMVEQICADDRLPAADILDAVTALADKSLVDVGAEVLGEVRYRLLETVREYAAAELAAAGTTDTFLRRRRDYTVRETERMFAQGLGLTPAPADLVDIIRRFDVESANVHEVLAYSLASGDAETGLRICRAMSPVMIMRGNFSEHSTWIEAFLALDSVDAVPDPVLAAIETVRAQLALATGSGKAEKLALDALEACRSVGERFSEASALNLLTEVALHAGRLEDAEASGVDALAVASASGDRWNAAYAIGTLSTLAAFRGKLREAASLADVALAGMQAIEQHWGTARALLGLGDLARLQADHEAARQYYLQALAYLRELESRPDTARCLAGLGRIAIEQGDLAAAREHLTESLELSFDSGSRIGMVRGLEVMARLSMLEGQPGMGVRLAGAFTALRLEAGLPEVPGARMQRLLDAAASLSPHEITLLWAEGASLSPADAIAVATGAAGTRHSGRSPMPRPAPQSLTAREREVVALIAAGKSNKEIASDLYISTATAARHVANIFAKLGYTSRSQVAVWAKSAEVAARAHRPS